MRSDLAAKSTGGAWPGSASPPALGPEAIQVWRVRLDVQQPLEEDFFATLSPDEQQRAGQFRFQADRRHFIAARGSLRVLLGKFLDTPPHRLCFDYGPKGKPSLRTASLPVHFNVAHCQDVAVCAFALGCQVGTDIEKVRLVPGFEQIARSYFSSSEFAQLMSVRKDLRPKYFLQFWTYKEACAKAIGAGLSAPLDMFELNVFPDGSARLASFNGAPATAPSWRLFPLTPFPDTVACVAAQGPGFDVHCYEFLPD